MCLIKATHPLTNPSIILKKQILSLLAGLMLASPAQLAAAPAPAPYGATPTKQQVDWLRMEWYAFVHFGLNTFTGREWGYGDESPELFNPTNFDAYKIASTFKEAGMTAMIYTAKHHDGWCAWPTKSTKHNITQSPWKGGKGDVVKEFSQACQEAGIKFGTYLSPWDRNCSEYGRPGYLKVYYKQIEELLTNYGDVFEIWFDGANGGDGYYGGAKENRNIGDAETYYNFPKIAKMIRKLQPNCIIWGAGHQGDVIWGGSEKGHVAYPLWNTQGNDPKHEKWISLEGDTPINHAGWFWHEGQSDKVKSPEVIMQVYLDSVGRGATLILNVAADKTGQLDEADVRSLLEFGQMRRRLLSSDYALGATATASEVRGNDAQFAGDKLVDGDIESYWAPEDNSTTGEIELTLKQPATFDVVRLREQIRLGQRVKAFQIDAWVDEQWKTVDAEGKTIGSQVLRKLSTPVTTDKVRLRVTDSRACPTISELSLLKMPKQMPSPSITREGSMVSISQQEGYTVLYTTDGSDPKLDSKEYNAPFNMLTAGQVKAAYLDDSDKSVGPTQAISLGYAKTGWKSSTPEVIDDKADTLWSSAESKASFTIDMGKEHNLGSFSYLPRQDGKTEGMTEQFILEGSTDGKKWTKLAEGAFGNLRANPIEQRIYLAKPANVRHVRFTSTKALDGSGSSVAEFSLFPSAKTTPKKNK